jgi:hypothetical protein
MAGLGAAAGAVGKSGGFSKLLGGLGGIGGAISIGSSLLGLLGGIGQKKRAKKMLAGLKDPGYVIPEEFKKNVGEAENMARVGLPSEQYNLATTNIQRGTQAGLRQLGRMSNPFAGIASLQRGQNDALAGLDASNAAARRQNMLGAMGARSAMAGQKLNQQQYAQQRYMDQVNQANALMGAGQQNTAGGLGALGQFGMMQSLYGQGGASQMGNSNNLQSIYSQRPLSVPSGFNNFTNPSINPNLYKFAGNNLSGIGSRLNTINTAKRPK